jgi:hypothetical protein
MKKHLSIVACAFAAMFLAAILYWGNLTASANAPSKGAPPSAKGAPAGAKAEGDGRPLKIFALRNADAEGLTKALQPLFADAGAPPTVIVFDKRSNTIIARGRESELTILEAILLTLDETPDQKSQD